MISVRAARNFFRGGGPTSLVALARLERRNFPVSLGSWFGLEPIHPDLPAHLQFRLRYFYEHESTDAAFQGGSDEVWISGVGLDTAAIVADAGGRPTTQTTASPQVGDVSDDAVRDPWRNQPHVLLDFDLHRAAAWPRSFSVTLLIVEEDNANVGKSFERLEAEVGAEVKAAAITAAAIGAGVVVGSVVPGIGTAVGAAVGAIVGVVYDDVIAEIKAGLGNEVFTPVTRVLTVDDPTAFRQHAGIEKAQKVEIRQHGARYEIEYDWHLVG